MAAKQRPKQTFEKVGRYTDPNKVRRKNEVPMKALVGGSCSFLGQSFPEGAHIDYAGKDYVCQGGNWVPD